MFYSHRKNGVAMRNAISVLRPSLTAMSTRSACLLILCGLFVALAAGALLAPAAPFTNDGAMYAAMARAMAENGAFHIGGNGGVDGAPALWVELAAVRDGFVYPQYPSGYALLAAPFYAAFGLHGLMLMNALSFLFCLYFTYRIARRFYGSETAAWAAAIFGLASFAPAYVFPIWPHMLSLAFWMGACFFAVEAGEEARKRSVYVYLALAGAMIGAGVNIRIDIVLAGIAIFVWLRAFSRPDDRSAPLFLVLGAAPGLLLAAWLNEIKFGAFTPFTYNASGGAASTARYLPALAATGAIAAFLWAFNVEKLFPKLRRTFGAVSLAAGLIAALAVLLAAPPLRQIAGRMLDGAYVLVVNLQAHDAYRQPGVAYNAYGHLLFWDYPKKALLQSLPYLPLIALPALYLFRRRNIRAVSLCLLSILAPIAFYALNEWHGGASYNMRYFTPTLPFIAILSAAAVGDLVSAAGRAPSRQTFLVVLAVAIVAYLGMQELARTSDRFLAPASLYPQWAIAAALSFALAAHLRAPGSAGRARAALIMSFAAISYAGAINIYEEITHEKTRAEQAAVGRDASASMPSDALVLSRLPLLLTGAEARGVSVMMATEKNTAEAAQAAEAFLAAGRCVYLHAGQRDLVEPSLQAPLRPAPLRAASRHYKGDPRLVFHVFEAQAEECAF